MLRQFRKSDADFIDDVKKTIAFWDRWRNFILPVFIILLIGLLGLLVVVGQFVFDPNNPIVGNQNKIPWVLGFLFGATFGLHLHGIMTYVIDAALGGYRAERILIELRAKIDELQDCNNR